MVNLSYNFSEPYTYTVSKRKIKEHIKNELFSVFHVPPSTEAENMIQYLLDNLFWEFFEYFTEEVHVRFFDVAFDKFSEEG